METQSVNTVNSQPISVTYGQSLSYTRIRRETFAYFSMKNSQSFQ